jgi:hypothetical protein
MPGSPQFPSPPATFNNRTPSGTSLPVRALFSPPQQTLPVAGQLARMTAYIMQSTVNSTDGNALAAATLRTALNAERKNLDPRQRALCNVMTMYPNSPTLRQVDNVHHIIRNERDLFLNDQSSYLPRK